MVSALPGRGEREEDVSFWILGKKGKEESGGFTGYYDGVAIAGKLYGFDSAVVT